MTGRFEVSGRLPSWGSVLVVVAHPDDESFGLGAVIDRFVESGATVGVLCFTHGEASTLHGVAGDLRTLRASELAAAARVLGISSVRLLDYPDGGLSGIPPAELADQVTEMATEIRAEGFLVFDSSGVTGHPDHVQATSVATMAGERLGLGVLAWTLPNPVPSQLAHEFGAGFTGRDPAEVDLVLPVMRSHQLEAVTCHPSQAVPGSVLWRRLELLGDVEHLRWLRSPSAVHGLAASSSLIEHTPGGILRTILSTPTRRTLDMCRQVTCRKCGNATWAGCGQHVDQVMRGVPKSKRCACPPTPSLVERLFGGRKAKV